MAGLSIQGDSTLAADLAGTGGGGGFEGPASGSVVHGCDGAGGTKGGGEAMGVSACMVVVYVACLLD